LKVKSSLFHQTLRDFYSNTCYFACLIGKEEFCIPDFFILK
jgi:hypothetical protein